MGRTCTAQAIPDEGDVELAKKLIAESGEPMPELTYQFPQTPVNEKVAASIQSSLAKAGITVKLEPIEAGQYYGIVFDPEKAKELIVRGLGAGLAQRLDGHPRAVRADRWLHPSAA